MHVILISDYNLATLHVGNYLNNFELFFPTVVGNIIYGANRETIDVFVKLSCRFVITWKLSWEFLYMQGISYYVGSFLEMILDTHLEKVQGIMLEACNTYHVCFFHHFFDTYQGPS